MKFRIISFLLVVLTAGTSAFAQKQVINYKRLKDFLPKDVPSYLSKKPTGETTSMMGMTNSHAEVKFEGKEIKTKETGEGGESYETSYIPTIEVKITDFMNIPMAGFAYGMMGESEKETETGYEKTTKLGIYPCTEKGDGEGEFKRFDLNIIVGNRFQVELRGEYLKDVNLLYDVVKKMDLAGLEKEGNK